MKDESDDRVKDESNDRVKYESDDRVKDESTDSVLRKIHFIYAVTFVVTNLLRRKRMYRFLKGWKHHYLVGAFKSAPIHYFKIQKNEVILTYSDGDFFSAGISTKNCSGSNSIFRGLTTISFSKGRKNFLSNNKS